MRDVMMLLPAAIGIIVILGVGVSVLSILQASLEEEQALESSQVTVTQTEPSNNNYVGGIVGYMNREPQNSYYKEEPKPTFQNPTQEKENYIKNYFSYRNEPEPEEKEERVAPRTIPKEKAVVKTVDQSNNATTINLFQDFSALTTMFSSFWGIIILVVVTWFVMKHSRL